MCVCGGGGGGEGRGGIRLQIRRDKMLCSVGVGSGITINTN